MVVHNTVKKLVKFVEENDATEEEESEAGEKEEKKFP